MAEQPYVKVEYKQVSSYSRKNRHTHEPVMRITTKCMINGASLRGHHYFVRCDRHKKTIGPFTSSAVAEAQMSTPWKWCDKCGMEPRS